MNESVIFNQEIGHLSFFHSCSRSSRNTAACFSRDLSFSLYLCIYFRAALLAESGQSSCRTDDSPF